MPLPDLQSPSTITTALILINLFTFIAFGFDKARAEAGEWRVQESTLLWLALLGGSPGAFVGRRVFRHKKRKQPFVARLWTITFLQALALGGWIGWSLGG